MKGKRIMYIRDSIQNISNHELLLFKKELRRIGVYGRYMNNRVNIEHLVVNPINGKIERCFRETKKETDERLIRFLRYNSERTGGMPPGSFCYWFISSAVSFTWSSTPEGYDFWDNVRIKLSSSPLRMYLNKMVRYVVAEELTNEGRQ